MKKLEELGISPTPWYAKQDSGYDRYSGDFNTSDTVYDAAGNVIADWWNGETYGEVHPNAEANARLIAAAPKLYEALYFIMECWGENVFDEGGMLCDNSGIKGCNGCNPNDCPAFQKARAALAEAAVEQDAVEAGSFVSDAGKPPAETRR